MQVNNTNLPKDKHDFKSVEVLAGLEGPEVLPLLPELLEWLQNMNWPVVSEIVDVLLKHKVETIPLVKTIFTQRDTSWIYNILAFLIKEWDTELVSRLSSSLQELAQTIDNYDDTDLLAIEILWNHRLIEVKDATALLVRKLSDTEDWLHNFTAEQKVVFSDLENERLHILNTDVKRIVNYIERNSKTLKQKDQYENFLRRHEEIEATIRGLSTG